MFSLTPKNRVLIDIINLLINQGTTKDEIFKCIIRPDISRQSKKYIIDKINYFEEKKYIKFNNN